MNYLLLASVLLGLAACQSNSTMPAAEAAPPAAANPAQAHPNSVTPEHIEWKMLTVNGQPHEPLRTALLESQLGRPDSIAKEAVECGGELEPVNNTNGDFWYYGKTRYEVSGPQAVLSSFDVTTGKFQGKLGKLVLNQHTTLEDVRRVFPVSAQEADAPATGQTEEVMHLPFFSEGQPQDASLNLIFKQGRLQQVEFFYPC